MANNVTDKLKETLNTTPKAIRWLLLITAFIVVLILLLLLLNRKDPVPTNGQSNDKNVQLEIMPADVAFLDVTVGTKKTQEFRINATDDAVIDSVELQNTVNGFSFTPCTSGFAINSSIPCVVDVTFIPAKAGIEGDVTLLVKWHDRGDSADINQKQNTLVIPVSSVNAFQQPEPPVVEPPVVEPPVVEPPVDDKDKDSDDDLIGGGRIFLPPEPEPTPINKPSEKCSDFAMLGYSLSGAEIGWIKPKNGRYEFHPFSDIECNKPTGIYNPNTGIITSIDGSGRKIGTDADHIGGTVDIDKLPKLNSKPGGVAQRQGSVKPHTSKGMGNLRETFNKAGTGNLHFKKNDFNKKALEGSGTSESVYSSMPYDRTFILRQFKPIPATIVSEVRADPSVYGCMNGSSTDKGTTQCDGGSGIPVRATVDRNVYSDDGRTIIIPTGTLLMGYLTGKLPGPYKSIGRMEIKWYQFIRPDGVEFNFDEKGDQDPYSGDAQGRVGVPGYGSTDYIEQMVMPLLTAMVPAAVNMIAPIADTFVNQIDLDNNTVVQSGKVRSSELAKNEVITAWNQIAQKLIVDALDNTVPPFSIAAGTRITVYSPVDLITTCGDDDNKDSEDEDKGVNPNAGKKCAFHPYGSKTRRKWSELKKQASVDWDDGSWTGQVRGFNLSGYCTQKNNVWTVKEDSETISQIARSGYEYRTVLAYCQAMNYQGKTQAKYDAYYQTKTANPQYTNQVDQTTGKVTEYDKDFNKEVLGLEYETDETGKETGVIKNPFGKTSSAPEEAVGSVDCDGQAPDQFGCCPGETYMEMGPDSEYPYACCPDGGGDCFPPLDVN